MLIADTSVQIPVACFQVQAKVRRSCCELLVDVLRAVSTPAVVVASQTLVGQCRILSVVQIDHSAVVGGFDHTGADAPLLHHILARVEQTGLGVELVAIAHVERLAHREVVDDVAHIRSLHVDRATS